MKNQESIQLESQIKESNIELLKFNYQNLHQSVWQAHGYAWTAITFLIPILFGIQGYLVKEYFKIDDQNWLQTFKVVAGVSMAEALLYIWWRIMKMFHHYNDVRIDQLKKIEDDFNRHIKGDITMFSQYNLFYDKRVSPMRIYRLIFTLVTVTGAVLIASRILMNFWNCLKQG